TGIKTVCFIMKISLVIGESQRLRPSAAQKGNAVVRFVDRWKCVGDSLTNDGHVCRRILPSFHGQQNKSLKTKTGTRSPSANLSCEAGLRAKNRRCNERSLNMLLVKCRTNRPRPGWKTKRR